MVVQTTFNPFELTNSRITSITVPSLCLPSSALLLCRHAKTPAKTLQFVECFSNCHLISQSSHLWAFSYSAGRLHEELSHRCYQITTNEGEPWSATFFRVIPAQHASAAFPIVAVFAPRMSAAHQLEHVPLPPLLEKGFVTVEEGHDRGSKREQSVDRPAGQLH